MLKKRICFSLLYFEGYFCVSRNFNLQKVGNIDWLLKNYDFDKILKYLDELIIININKNFLPEVYTADFFKDIKKIIKKSFLTISLGGSINNFELVKKLFAEGADKVMLNSAFYNNKDLISKIVDLYGSQSVVASIDYTGSGLLSSNILMSNGSKKISDNLKDHIRNVQNWGAGELLLNSIDRDGLGYGYDYKTLEDIYPLCNIPIIAAGGADNHLELKRGIDQKYIDAVSTSHLFNFMGEGLLETRIEMIKNNSNLPIRNA